MVPKNFRLPVSIVGPSDIARLAQELDALDEQLLQLHIRKPGTEISLPKTSKLLDETVEANQLNLLREDDRRKLRESLEAIRTGAPKLHISFGADPSAAFMEKLIAWLRQEVHPLVLVTTGLRPTIGVGCSLRSLNRSFDFSLRQNFTNKRHFLLEKLAMSTAPPPANQETPT